MQSACWVRGAQQCGEQQRPGPTTTESGLFLRLLLLDNIRQERREAAERAELRSGRVTRDKQTKPELEKTEQKTLSKWL